MRYLRTGAKPPLKSAVFGKTALCLDAASWEGGLAPRHETRDRDIWQKRGAAQGSGGAGSRENLQDRHLGGASGPDRNLYE